MDLWDVPEEARELLRDWLDRVRVMAERAASDAAPAPEAGASPLHPLTERRPHRRRPRDVRTHPMLPPPRRGSRCGTCRSCSCCDARRWSYRRRAPRRRPLQGAKRRARPGRARRGAGPARGRTRPRPSLPPSAPRWRKPAAPQGDEELGSEAHPERKAFEGEVARIKGIFEVLARVRTGSRSGRAQGQPAGKILARLRAAGLDLDASNLAAAVLEPSDDERPMTVREWNERQRKADEDRRKADEEAKAKAKGDEEAKAKQARDASESAFVAMASAERAPVSAKVLARFGAHGRALLIDRAWKAQTARVNAGQPYSLDLLLTDVETAVAKEFPEFAPALRPPQPPRRAHAFGREAEVLCRTTWRPEPPDPNASARKSGGPEFERKQQAGGAIKWGLSLPPPSKTSSTRFTRGEVITDELYTELPEVAMATEGLRWKASSSASRSLDSKGRSANYEKAIDNPFVFGLGGFQFTDFDNYGHGSVEQDDLTIGSTRATFATS